MKESEQKWETNKAILEGPEEQQLRWYGNAMRMEGRRIARQVTE
jgi:hypothetical protein